MTVDPATHADREEQQLVMQLTVARARLVDDLGGQGLSADEVNRTFDAVAARFANARVRSFVPILVERVVRARSGSGRTR